QQGSLEKQQAHDPHFGRASEPGQDQLGDQRFDREQQEGTEKDRNGRKQRSRAIARTWRLLPDCARLRHCSLCATFPAPLSSGRSCEALLIWPSASPLADAKTSKRSVSFLSSTRRSTFGPPTPRSAHGVKAWRIGRIFPCL